MMDAVPRGPYGWTREENLTAGYVKTREEEKVEQSLSLERPGVLEI
jgi:hypothetical protein